MGLSRFKVTQKVFVIITAGNTHEAGFSFRECETILANKNCEIIYSEVVRMPVNWITSSNPPFPPSERYSLKIIKNGVRKAEVIANNIINKNYLKYIFKYPKHVSRFSFYKDYFLFKYLGVTMLWSTFRVYDTCTGCGLCSRLCPVRSIKIKNGKPKWSAQCEQCMRCVNFCPNEAIYQLYGGDTINKYRYHATGFNPSF
jgi:formate hydrogenlyase subunit 6/NADH:ubiquinone oxidoreductase subunit I